jgi:zinc-ribbon domain
MHCPRCRHENPSGQKFCGACGTPLTANPSGPPAPSYAEITSTLSEAREQQTATAEILRVISSTPTDLEPVFDAIVRRAVSLGEAVNGSVFRFDERLIHLVAHRGFTPDARDAIFRMFPCAPGRGSIVGRAILTRSVTHVDIAKDPEYGSTRWRPRAPKPCSGPSRGENHRLAPFTRMLIERAEGNPFFLEESVQTLVETRMLIGERGAYRLARTPEVIQLPATALAILAACIDRLPPEEKRLLQAVAGIGKDVPFWLR